MTPMGDPKKLPDDVVSCCWPKAALPRSAKTERPLIARSRVATLALQSPGRSGSTADLR
jgi:hypothetical protein